jgi:hypothetical protein
VVPMMCTLEKANSLPNVVHLDFDCVPIPRILPIPYNDNMFITHTYLLKIMSWSPSKVPDKARSEGSGVMSRGIFE